MKKILLFLFVTSYWLLVTTCYLHASDQIEIKADKLMYDEALKKVFAEKDVEISSANFKMSGQKMDIDLDRQYAIAEGSVTIKDDNSIIFGNKCEYCYSTSTGYIYDAYGYYYPWGFKGEKIYKDKYELYLGKSEFTTCNLKEPHYFMSVKNAVIKPGKKMEAKNTVIRIQNIPVFYYPTYTYSMGERTNSLEIYPGYNTYDGILIKTIYGFPVSQQTYTKIYLDWYQEQGIGKGLEYNYVNPDKIKGSTYLYHIREEKNLNERWTLKSSHWQKLSKTWSLQGNVNYQSDEYFNKYYFGQNWNRLSSDVKSDIAFTKQTSKINLQIIANRHDVYNSASGEYILEEYNVPRIDLTLFQFKPAYLPFYTGLTTNLYRNYSRPVGTVTWNSSSDLYITKQFPVSIRTTITPKFGIIENWKLLLDTHTYITNYYSALSLRQKINWFTYMDFTHNYKTRSVINSSDIDASASDYGVETNNLATMLYISQRSDRYMRISTNYELKENRTTSFRSNLSRFSALITEIGTPLSNKLSIYLNHQYNIEFSSTVSVQTELTYMPSGKASFTFGIYQQKTTGETQFKNSSNFWLTNKWQIGFNIISMLTEKDIKIIEEGIKIYRDLHCWETSATYQKRGEIEEYFFNIGLKISSQSKKGLYDQKHENEFYPWR